MLKTSVLAGTLLVALGVAGASAQSRCRVSDPTGTPLNVRAAPNGPVIGNAMNGALVTVLARTTDNRGRPWVHVAHLASGEPMGWVFREFISCY